MKNYKEMTEEDLLESHFEATQEIADLMRGIISMKRRVIALSKDLDNIDMEFESREAKKLKKENKLI